MIHSVTVNRAHPKLPYTNRGRHDTAYWAYKICTRLDEARPCSPPGLTVTWKNLQQDSGSAAKANFPLKVNSPFFLLLSWPRTSNAALREDDRPGKREQALSILNESDSCANHCSHCFRSAWPAQTSIVMYPRADLFQRPMVTNFLTDAVNLIPVRMPVRAIL